MIFQTKLCHFISGVQWWTHVSYPVTMWSTISCNTTRSFRIKGHIFLSLSVSFKLVYDAFLSTIFRWQTRYSLHTNFLKVQLITDNPRLVWKLAGNCVTILLNFVCSPKYCVIDLTVSTRAGFLVDVQHIPLCNSSCTFVLHFKNCLPPGYYLNGHAFRSIHRN